ncbi:hypothetical protein AAHC03_09363 [Spirometra sp. Aus1]
MSSIKKESPFQKYASGEKILCFHGPLLYEAKCLDVKVTGDEVQYFVHYQGWNKNWDEWVTDRRMYKYDEAGLRKQKELEKLAKSGKKMKILRKSDLKNQPYPPPELIEKVEKAIRPEESGKTSRTTAIPTPIPEETPTEQQASETSDSEQPPPKAARQSSALDEKPPKPTPTSGTNRKKKGRSGIADITGETEEGFLSRPRIQVNFPENLRAWLVDDWDLITKQSRLFVLPARKTVASILDEYLEESESSKAPESKEGPPTPVLTAELRQEFVAGLRVNFNFILGSQLLYKFERLQYADILKSHSGKEMTDIYGPMHLLRLLIKLRDLITFVKVDQGSLSLLESLVTDFISFLERNQDEFFRLEDYTMATADYLRLAMC